MGIREYFKNSGNDTRWKLSAGLAVFFHAVVLLGGSLVMAQKAEYGMAGSVASGGNPRVVQTQVLETVELDASDDDAPAEHHKKQKPTPTPVIPTGIGGRVSGTVSEVAAYYRNPPPVYSLEVRARKEEGVVMLRAEVDTQGKVTSVSLVQSSGFADLDESALDAVKNWQFKPAQIAGIPVSSSAKIPIRFRLKDFR
jgi:periplasmic protein TonB